MLLQDVLAALALCFVIEGMLPFLNPGLMRRWSLLLASLDDGSLRAAGLTSMVVGIIVLYLVNS